jgi:hypothetical protein
VRLSAKDLDNHAVFAKMGQEELANFIMAMAQKEKEERSDLWESPIGKKLRRWLNGFFQLAGSIGVAARCWRRE